MDKEKLALIKEIQRIKRQLRELNKTNKEILNELRGNTESR